MYVYSDDEKEKEMTKILSWVWLTSSLKFSSRAIARVLYKFTPYEAYCADEDTLKAAGIDGDTAEKLLDKDTALACRIVEKCEKENIKIIPSSSPDYPRALERLPDKPFVLYVKGDITCINGRKTAAFVGTRRMTAEGHQNGERIAQELIDSGYVLISGLASGIDTVAAEMSLKKNVPTVAVLGVDIDKYFPAENTRLTDRVAETGAVISEYPPYTGARFFPARNRIIVGLSDIVNVIESPSKSGSMITGRLSLKMKIPTYALCLEGSSFDGCRELVANGALPIGSTKTETAKKAPVKKTPSVKKAPSPKKKEPEKETKSIPDDVVGTRRYIWEKLLSGPVGENALVDSSHSIQEVLCALTELELDGYIRALPGGRYALK